MSPDQKTANIGINLTSTKISAAIKSCSTPVRIDFAGDRTMRSVVSFAHSDNRVIVGNEAVPYIETDPEQTISSVNKYLGKNKSYEFEREHLTYKPEMLVGLLLKKLRRSAKKHMGTDVNEATIAIPAYFTEDSRACVEAAAVYANFDNIVILSRPIAACIAHDFDVKRGERKTIAVYEILDSTTEISIIDITSTSDGMKNYELKTSHFKYNLGKNNLDKLLTEHIIAEFATDTGIVVSEQQGRKRVEKHAKEVRSALSSKLETDVKIPFLTEGEDVEQTITRKEFNELGTKVVKKSLDICSGLFDDIEYNPSDIDRVLPVGSFTELPFVSESLREFFDQKPLTDDHPEETGINDVAEVTSCIRPSSYADEKYTEQSDSITLIMNQNNENDHNVTIISESRLSDRRLRDSYAPPSRSQIKAQRKHLPKVL